MTTELDRAATSRDGRVPGAVTADPLNASDLPDTIAPPTLADPKLPPFQGD